MEEGLRGLIDGYKAGINPYLDLLPKENKIVSEVEALIRDMEELAEKNSYTEFMEKASAKDYFNRIIGYYSKLALEQSKLSPKRTTIPTPSEIAKGYHLAYESLPKDVNLSETKIVYERVFQLEKESKTGPEFLCKLEEEDLFLEMSRSHLMEVMRNGLEKMLQSGSDFSSDGKGVVSNPQMEHYFQRMQKQMKEARSLTELEFNALLRAEDSRFSNLWDTTFLNVIFNALMNPLISWRMNPSEELRKEVEAAYLYLNEFWGLDWESLFGISRVSEFFETAIFGGSGGQLKSQNIHSAMDLKKDLEACLLKCLKGKSLSGGVFSANAKIFFRGKEIQMKEIKQALGDTTLP
ncbi:hypothetical protein LPTSP3_g09390 [Leptospira kobayashii]|uniref:Uncharacterized protein n=1 Tax=Leptospira kobayashii TaxID=1917830 RepID=A0ABN6KCI2_9LEPT|nr:hypothetical protein [Leptospira kobayashii]BDA78009.1 hypothetical protein LPTSP3_g09390 [Leptospira kobayashii]